MQANTELQQKYSYKNGLLFLRIDYTYRGTLILWNLYSENSMLHQWRDTPALRRPYHNCQQVSSGLECTQMLKATYDNVRFANIVNITLTVTAKKLH